MPLQGPEKGCGSSKDSSSSSSLLLLLGCHRMSHKWETLVACPPYFLLWPESIPHFSLCGNKKQPLSSDYEAFSHCISSLDLLELGTVILQLIVKKGCLNNTVYWENMLLKLLQAK